jgi:FAD/FMN-containing dehydrogenase
MIEIDKISLLVATDTDLTMAELEGSVLREGFVLNYFTPPDNKVLLADVLSERLPNIYGKAFGGIEDLCIQVHLTQSDGAVFSNVLTPRSATGPSLKNLALGSGEMLGIPFQATLKIFPKPAVRKLACVVFSSLRLLESFTQNLNKQRFFLPLLHRLPKEIAKSYVKDLKDEEVVLAFANWGEEKMMEACWYYLQHQADLKKGIWFEVDMGKIWRDLFKELQHEATQPYLNKKEYGESSVPPSHLQLMHRLQRLA